MKIKALFLLFIFLFNTGVGLNCAFHKDMDCCKDIAQPTQQGLTLKSQGHPQPLTTVSEDDPCCQNMVNSFAALAKLVPQSANVLAQVPIAYISTDFYYSLKSSLLVEINRPLLIDARQRPPTPDLRIVIQSFLI